MSTSDKLPDMEEPAVGNSALEGATSSLGVIEKIPEPKQQEMCSKTCLRSHTRTLRQSRKPTRRVYNNRKEAELLRRHCGWERTESPTFDWGQGGRTMTKHQCEKGTKNERQNTLYRSVDFTVLWHAIKLWYLWYLYLAVQPCCALTIWPGGYFYRLLMDGLESCYTMTAFTSRSSSIGFLLEFLILLRMHLPYSCQDLLTCKPPTPVMNEWTQHLRMNRISEPLEHPAALDFFI